MKYYLRIEGVNLNNFVYDTQDLSTIRGSGLAILEAVSFLEKNAVTGIELTRISSGASAGLFEFEIDENADFNSELFCKNIRNELNKKEAYRYATFVIDILPFTEDSTDNFQLDREKILAKNRWQQMQSPRLATPEHNEHIVKNASDKVACELDFIRFAQNPIEFKGKPHIVSDSAYFRREYGSEKKQKFIKNELTEFNKTIREPYKLFDLELIKAGKFVNDFTSLSTNANKPKNIQNKMAVIYLDGNDFGKAQRNLAIEELKDFDTEKTEFQRNWLARLMEKVVEADDWKFREKDNQVARPIYQLEILLWGGDEICLVVPAWKGWEVIEQFYQLKFEWNSQVLTHSLGAVFCHHNAPIRQIKNLASSLADLAKGIDPKGNYFAYEILESFDHISKDLAEHRKSRCPQNGFPDKKDLILDGNKISKIIKKDSIEANAFRLELERFKSFMPKRKLNQIVQKLLRADKYAEALPLIEEVMKDLNKDAELANLADFLNGNEFFWTHALALWDFIEEPNQ